MSNDRHHIAELAAEAAKSAALKLCDINKCTPAQAANAVVKAYRKAIADLSAPIKTKEQE